MDLERGMKGIWCVTDHTSSLAVDAELTEQWVYEHLRYVMVSIVKAG